MQANFGIVGKSSIFEPQELYGSGFARVGCAREWGQNTRFPKARCHRESTRNQKPTIIFAITGERRSSPHISIFPKLRASPYFPIFPFGDLFYACCDEVNDISFIEVLYRMMVLAADRLKKSATYCEKTVAAFFSTLIDAALQYVGLSKNNVGFTNAIPES